MKLMPALFMLLFAQDSAEATFQKIEAAFAKADSIKVTVKCKAVWSRQGIEMKGEIEGTLLIKGENKVRISMTVKEGEEPPQELAFVSDGAKMRGPGTAAAEVHKDLRKSLLTVLPKLGVAQTMQTAMTIGAGRPGEKAPVASKFAVKESRLNFDVAYDGSTWKSVVDFDPKTHGIVKLEIRVTPVDPRSPGKAGVGRLITETVQVEFGVDLPDKEFEIVEKK
ncbi:MAG TPA: hypothetical protein VJU16_08715 [Planctomycetota bacterium]|nr:hypothetical protein [Planctomycetota bacterium]